MSSRLNKIFEQANLDFTNFIDGVTSIYFKLYIRQVTLGMWIVSRYYDCTIRKTLGTHIALCQGIRQRRILTEATGTGDERHEVNNKLNKKLECFIPARCDVGFGVRVCDTPHSWIAIERAAINNRKECLHQLGELVGVGCVEDREVDLCQLLFALRDFHSHFP